MNDSDLVDYHNACYEDFKGYDFIIFEIIRVRRKVFQR